jgi:hypothetical protein
LAAAFGLAHAESVPIAVLSSGQIAGWEVKKFKGETRYEAVSLDGRRVLRAESAGSASGLVRKIRIDLRQTPYLNWSWRRENALAENDEQSKVGDDYSARVYVIIEKGLMFWRLRSLNYVWARTSLQGQSWPNVFAGRSVVMIAQRSGAAEIGEWHREKRNVRMDIQRYFGEDASRLDAVALMTDTDNAGGRAVAYYGDIYFTAD